jgi:type I restriction enzyme S subunit
MREGWELKKLNEVCDIKPPKKEAKDILNDTDLVTFLPMEDLGILSKHIIPTKERLLKDVSGSYTYFAENDILLAKITPCFENGKIGIARNLTNGIGFGSSEYIVFRSKGEVIQDYLFYFLSRDSFREEGKKQMTGAVGHKRLSKEYIENCFLPYPKSLSEQQRIVAILDEAFAAIARAKANAEQNLKNAKELFESYLQSVFENNGEDWEKKTLGDVCSLYQGIAINAKTKHALVEKSELPLLRIKDLKDNTEEQYIDPNNYPKNALVNKSDIIYTRTGSLGLVFRGRVGVLHNNSFKVVPNSELDKDFLYIWLQNPAFKAKILSLALKAAQPDITHAIFKIQKIAIPPIHVQKILVQKLDVLSAECKKLEAIYQKKIEDLDELKKSILQKAFSGELTAKEAVTI